MRLSICDLLLSGCIALYVFAIVGMDGMLSVGRVWDVCVSRAKRRCAQ